METLLFHPFPQYLRFGGDTLKQRKRWRDSDRRDQPLAEVWEISDHRLHSSVVRNGEQAGKTLHDLLVTQGPALLGRHQPDEQGRFPLMIRLLDVRENLVPALHPGPGGSSDGVKFETGYVLECDPGAKFYSGLREDVTVEDMIRMSLEGQSFSTMDAWDVAPGESYYVPAGKLHAWGVGSLLYEVHTTSNAIFALDWMDWDKDDARRQSDRDGVVRWIDPALRGSGKSEPTVLPSPAGVKRELCDRNDHYLLERLTIRKTLDLGHDENRFHLYTLIRGGGRLNDASIAAFDTFLVPTQCEADRFAPDEECVLLKAYLP